MNFKTPLKAIQIHSLLLFLVLTASYLFPLSAYADQPGPKPPRLIVGIVIDQMRYDYITRYWDKFGENGFRKLVNQGFNCANTHYNYVPTYTGPGHASIYTGTTPAVHGIIGNNWYSREYARDLYVTEDTSVQGLGTAGPAGKMSPKNMFSTTFCDELRIASNMRSKVIGIALKDRGAILPAGFSANGAYWLDGISGNWISSSWYFKELPSWVNSFNKRKLPESYLKNDWNTLLPVSGYQESTPDSNGYEEPFPGETSPVFPHHFNSAAAAPYDLIRYSPYGMTLTREFAIEAMQKEELGKDDFTDVLAVSFSTPDLVGHQFGTHAIETEDTYLRLDKELAELIIQAEKWCGKENVLFFLTADHAAIPNPKFLSDRKIPAKTFNTLAIADSLQKHLADSFGNHKWMLALRNDQVYFDYNLLDSAGISMDRISDETIHFLSGINGVASVMKASQFITNEYTWGVRSFIQKGFMQKRSGDVVMILEPGIVEYKEKGTTHGTSYTYDTHVPLLFYGWKMPKGLLQSETCITDIAPTISRILGLQPPSGNTGKVIDKLLENIH